MTLDIDYKVTVTGLGSVVEAIIGRKPYGCIACAYSRYDIGIFGVIIAETLEDKLFNYSIGTNAERICLLCGNRELKFAVPAPSISESENCPLLHSFVSSL